MGSTVSRCFLLLGPKLLSSDAPISQTLELPVLQVQFIQPVLRLFSKIS